MASHWSRYGAHWASLGPPLRPSPGVVEAYRSALSAHPGHTVLLGVTPELAALGEPLTAVDRSPGMVAAVWPGDAADRHAVIGDWRALPLADGVCAAALGDGALNTLPDATAQQQVLAELARVLRPGGRAALRVFCRPEAPEPLARVWDDARAGLLPFHAFKWRVAMAMAGARSGPGPAPRDGERAPGQAPGDGDSGPRAAGAAGAGVVEVRAVRDAILAEAPARWAAQAGWTPAELATLEVYAGSSDRYTFPTEREWLTMAAATFARAGLTPVGGYPLAERCPLLVLERAG